MNKKALSKECIIDVIVFILLLIVVSSVTLTLFYRQACAPNPDVAEAYGSDMYHYVLEVKGMSDLLFPYPIFFKLAAFIKQFTKVELAVALTLMLLNSLAIIEIKLALNQLVLKPMKGQAMKKGSTCLIRIVLSLLAVSLFFISMLYPPEGFKVEGMHYKYLGVFSANPYHNATYLAARPFAILAFLWYVKLLPVCDGDSEGISFWDYFLFSIFLVLSTMTKPSFTLVMVSTAGLLMLYRIFQSTFRNFYTIVKLGLCFIPTFIEMFRQYMIVYGSKSDGLCFGFGEVWVVYCDNIPLAIFFAIAFPLVVLACNLKECKRNSLFRYSWQLYLVAFAEAFLLYEGGDKKFHFNFAWGYMYGIFFCHFGALLILLQGTLRRMVSGEVRRRISADFLLLLQWAMYLCHVICGLLYFKEIFEGKLYF